MPAGIGVASGAGSIVSSAAGVASAAAGALPGGAAGEEPDEAGGGGADWHAPRAAPRTAAASPRTRRPDPASSMPYTTRMSSPSTRVARGAADTVDYWSRGPDLATRVGRAYVRTVGVLRSRGSGRRPSDGAAGAARPRCGPP